jgi:hypothetical protein
MAFSPFRRCALKMVRFSVSLMDMSDLIAVTCRVCRAPYECLLPRPRRNESVCQRCRVPSKRELLSEAQGYRCAICNRHTSEIPLPSTHECTLVRDHDHVTGRVRGMLCQFCNLMLGYAQDDLERLENAIRYLKNPPAQ